MSNPKVFISYSWEENEHKEWVKSLANHLIEDGVDAVIDQYDLKPGDRLTVFMEQISAADYVLVVCTPTYKDKADNREGGVGYEYNIITSELFEKNNEEKFLPILRKGDFSTALPVYMKGKMAIDLRGEGLDSESYRDLLVTLYGKSKKPVLGKKTNTGKDAIRNSHEKQHGSEAEKEEPIRILGIITDKVTMPRMDGTRGCALYKVPFRLSRRPSNTWAQLFINEWNHPRRFTTMHRPGIASIQGDMIVLDGTTVEEVRDYHRDTLVLCVEETNVKEEAILENEKLRQERAEKQKHEHESNVKTIANGIQF